MRSANLGWLDYNAAMTNVTRILSQIEQGDPSASERLLPLVYSELRRLAAAKMASEKPGQTLQPTALVHEAYVRLVDGDSNQKWDSRGHFFAAAAEAIRRILIEQARRKAGPKAGGHHRRVSLATVAGELEEPDWDLLHLDEALKRFEVVDARAAKIVNLRFFAGFTIQEAAQTLKISIATANNDWAYAKGWLQVRLSDAADPSA